MKTIAVLAATAHELSGLLKVLGSPQTPRSTPGAIIHICTGTHDLALCTTGIGTANAAITATDLFHRITPDLLIMTGCAGAYPASGLTIGDLAVATSELFADDGVETPSGWHPLDLIGIPLLENHGHRYYNEIPLPAAPVTQVLDYARRQGISIAHGRFLTVNTCSGTKRRGEELYTRFGGLCENMEGAAVALAALRFGVPFLEVRGISNLVEDRDLSRWDIASAMASVTTLLAPLLKEPPFP